MNNIFILTCLIHILIWSIVLLGFLDKKIATINIYILIPLIYLLHALLPFHLLVSIKKQIYPYTYEYKEKEVNSALIIPHYYIKLSEIFDNYCTFNPLSPQGMLIFGLISSTYSLKYYHK
tara:strand:- start:78 stop:437 length:360 start_codon:yes stop_codon:yes gene_type:complete